MIALQFVLVTAIAFVLMALLALAADFDRREMGMAEMFLFVLFGLLAGILVCSLGLLESVTAATAAAGAFTRDIPLADWEAKRGYVRSARAHSGYAFEHCETCTNRYKCAKEGCCEHNAAAVHCTGCGRFLINEGIEGHLCRNAACELSPDYQRRVCDVERRNAGDWRGGRRESGRRGQVP